MKKAHRSAHHLSWLIVAPVMAAIIYFAVTLRTETPVNAEIPASIAEDENS